MHLERHKENVAQKDDTKSHRYSHFTDWPKMAAAVPSPRGGGGRDGSLNVKVTKKRTFENSVPGDTQMWKSK